MTTKSTSETGHAKVVANLNQIGELVKTYEPAYNPGKYELSVAALSSQHAVAESAMENIHVLLETSVSAINNRELLFKNLGSLSTRTVNVFCAFGASPAIVKDVKGVLSKFRGKRISKPALPDPDDPTS